MLIVGITHLSKTITNRQVKVKANGGEKFMSIVVL